MNPNKSYRVRTTPKTGDSTKLNITLNQDYDFVDILSLKLDQKNLYRTPRSEYGCIIGRVMANGGVGVPNARISIFIPITESSKRSIEKRVLYPYDTSFDKNYQNIRYNLFANKNIDECHQVIGTFPLKRAILDNNDILEIFDNYYKYSTVTNNSGDYMLFGIPIGSNQVHCDIDLSDCGHLSQMPRDMYYKGYSVDQFESSTQFKKDTNLDNLAQVFAEDSSVYVYPFWGDGSEDEVGITRHDINISYRFETTCIFIGSIITDSDNATTYTSCLPQAALGEMKDLTAKQGTIEMIRLEPDGRIVNYKIKGNQLIDGDGVWCYQIPMNLDYYTTDEFGNEVLSDNPTIGIPSRTDVRFKIKIEQPEELHKKKACYLVPHNPNIPAERDYTLSKDTPKHLFVSMFKNNIYSVKSYIPRIQSTKSPRTQNNTGIKNIQNHASSLPFPYNEMRSHLPTQFSILCAISAIVIEFQRVWNQFITALTKLSCRLQLNPGVTILRNYIGFCLCIDVCRLMSQIICSPNLKCMHIDPSWCQYTDILLYPGCFAVNDSKQGCPGASSFHFSFGRCGGSGNEEMGCRHIIEEMKDTTDSYGGIPRTTNPDSIWDCVITTLAEGIGVSFFNFTNDWVNGVLYFPTFNFQKRKKSRRKFLGIFGKKKVTNYEDVCSFEGEEWIQRSSGTTVGISKLVEFGIKKTRVYKICSPKYKINTTNHIELRLFDEEFRGCYDNMYEYTFNGRIRLKSHEKARINKQKCHEEYTEIELAEPFINREKIGEDINGEPIYEYYYRPIAERTSNNGKNINLFKTDVILIGSLDKCNKHGIWGLYKELPITTYQMPGPMYEIDYQIKVISEGSSSTEGRDEIVWDESIFIASGKNWGSAGGRNLTDQRLRETAGSYRIHSVNNSGGLFYGIGCTRFETKIKTCVNLERICELGVDLDIYHAIEGVCDANDATGVFVTPQGWIGKDQLIRGVETRQQFATLNQPIDGKYSCLNRYRLENDELSDNLISNKGKKYYNFEYVYPTNFDGRLRGIFNQSSVTDANARQNNAVTNRYNALNESYIDPEYLYFRYGLRTLNTSIALSVEEEKNIRHMSFFQPINSFYFYFGIKSGSTAIEKLRQKFTAQCFQSTDETVQIQVNVVTHPYICNCARIRPTQPPLLTIPPPSIKIEVIGSSSDYKIIIRNSDGVSLHTLGNYTITTNSVSVNTLNNETLISVSVTSLNIQHPEFANEGTFSVSFVDDYGNISQSTFTLRYQNKVIFNLREVSPIFDEVSSSVTCMPPLRAPNNPNCVTCGRLLSNCNCIFEERHRETCAMVVLENITNISIKNCILDNYNLEVRRQEINIGRDAIFTVSQTGVVAIKTTNRGSGYKSGAYGVLGNGLLYVEVLTTNAAGGILTTQLVDEFGTIQSPQTATGYPQGDYLIERMSMLVAQTQTYNIPDSITSVYNNLSDENRRTWSGFRLYLCEGEYRICLVGKNSVDSPTTTCVNRDIYCDSIIVSTQPGISLIFRDESLYAKYFLPQTINHGTPNQQIVTPQDNRWWDEFFKFLRGTVGKNEATLLTEFKKWYDGALDETNERNIREKISLLKEMWMPTCSTDIPIIQLNGTGYFPPMRTLLYGAIKIETHGGNPSRPRYLLCASDSYNSLNKDTETPPFQSPYNFNDIPYQTQQSSMNGLIGTYRVRNDQNVVYTTPAALTTPNQTTNLCVAERNNLTPEDLVFTTSRIPIQTYPNTTNDRLRYEPGGFYAAVIGQNGIGRAGGYDNSLSLKIKQMQNNEVFKDISAWELLYGTPESNFSNGIIADWNHANPDAPNNRFLFKFHVLDQTLKIFKEWNRIAAPHNGYIDPFRCSKRNIPAYFSIFYLNGPLLELTVDVENSEFDLVGANLSDDIIRNAIPEVEHTIRTLETLPVDQDPPDNLVFVNISPLVTDYRTHLGTCPLLVPNVRHFYSTGRYTGAGGISIEQREIIVDPVTQIETVDTLCTDLAVPELLLEVTNRNHKVYSFINTNCTTVTNHYSHTVDIPSLETEVMNTLISGGGLGEMLNRFNLHQMGYTVPQKTCTGTGASIHWRTIMRFESARSYLWMRRRETQNESIWNSGSSSRPQFFRLLTRGEGYDIGQNYRILSDSNNNDTSSEITVFVTGSVVGIRMESNPEFELPNNVSLTDIRWVSCPSGFIGGFSGGGINNRQPGSNNPTVRHSNVGEGVAATFSTFPVPGSSLDPFNTPNPNDSNPPANVGSSAFTFTSRVVTNEDGTTTTLYRLSQINLGNFRGKVPGVGSAPHNLTSGYISEPDFEIVLRRQTSSTNQTTGVTTYSYPQVVTVRGKGVLGSNYFPQPSVHANIYRYDPPRTSIASIDPPRTTEINITGVGRGVIRTWVQNEDQSWQMETTSIEGAMYSFAIAVRNNTNNSYEYPTVGSDSSYLGGVFINTLKTRGQLLRETKSSNGRFFWQPRVTVERYDWMSDLFCNKTIGEVTMRRNETNPEDLLHYNTLDDWNMRFSFPYFTENYGRVYADINAQVNEPVVNCSPSLADEYSTNTRKHTTDVILSNLASQSRTTLGLFLPFHGNVTAGAANRRTLFYSVLHDNEDHVRAFSQPMDFGNYIYIDENSITCKPTSATDPSRYEVKITIEIRGTNAFKCHGYRVRIQQGQFETERATGSVDLRSTQGWDLFDSTAEATTGVVGSNGRWIRLRTSTPINTWNYRIDGLPIHDTSNPQIEVTLTNCVVTDINRLLRISATDVTGLEMFTYISLFRWIDQDPRLTFCVYNCNKNLERAMNTGVVIDFEWENNISNRVGEKIAYLTRLPNFPDSAPEYPIPILMQGKNLIHTTPFSGNQPPATTLSDNTTIPRNYRGTLYLWFSEDFINNEEDEEQEEMTRDDLNNYASIAQKIEVTASSCYISYKVISS